MKNILIPFDFSSVSLNALEYAVKFARNDEAITLFLLHINNEEEKERHLSRKFQKVISKYHSPLSPTIETIVRQGEIIPSILKIQEQLEVDLIIMGTTGADGNEDETATRTSRFVQQADLPVLVIPETAKFFKLHNIILTLGRDKIADRTPLYVLLDISRKFNAQVHVLTVHRAKVEMGYSEEDESNENTLQYFLEMFYSHHFFTENEDIEKGIKDYVEKYDIDMVAIMPKTHLENGEASEGKLTKHLTLHSDIPLLVLD